MMSLDDLKPILFIVINYPGRPNNNLRLGDRGLQSTINKSIKIVARNYLQQDLQDQM